MRKGFVIDDGETVIEIEFAKTLGKTQAGHVVLGKFKEATRKRPARIRILGGLDNFKILAIILHELLHRYEDANYTELDHNVLDEIARFLARTMRNSPRLVEFITMCTNRRK